MLENSNSHRLGYENVISYSNKVLQINKNLRNNIFFILYNFLQLYMNFYIADENLTKKKDGYYYGSNERIKGCDSQNANRR